MSFHDSLIHQAKEQEPFTAEHAKKSRKDRKANLGRISLRPPRHFSRDLCG
jgi:hypothetical protein